MLSFVRDADWLTLKRVELIGVLLAIGVLLVVGLDFWAHSRDGVTNAAGEHLGRDFVGFWAGGRAVLSGQGARVFDVNWFWAFERTLVGARSEFKLYSYPPVGELLTAPIGLFPYVVGLTVWLLGGAVACAWVLSRSLGWRLAAIASVGAPAVMLNTLSGQNGALSAALMGGALAALPRRPILAGVLFGLLSYKPQLGLVIPIALLAGGYWRTIAAAAATVVLLVGVSALTLGVGAWTTYIQHTLPLNGALLAGGASFWHRMPTAFAFVRLLGLPSGAAYAAQALSAGLAVGAVVAVWRSKASLSLKGAGLILASLLTPPYAWDYDLVMVTLAVAWLAVDWAVTGFRPWEKSALFALALMPILMSPIAKSTRLQIGPVILGIALVLLVQRALGPTGADALAPGEVSGATAA